MPSKTTAKKTVVKSTITKKTPVKKKRAASSAKQSVKVAAPTAPAIHSGMYVCRSCHALPAGSIEIVSLMLVLVFSLTAVLVTSVHALAMQNQHIENLQAQTFEG